MSSLIPKLLTRPKTFTSRIVLVQNATTHHWIPDPSRSELMIDEALLAWQEAEKADVRFVSPPAISIYQNSSTEQTMFVSVSVLYVPAVEGAHSDQPAKPVEPVAAKAKPERKDTAGVFGPPRK